MAALDSAARESARRVLKHAWPQPSSSAIMHAGAPRAETGSSTRSFDIHVYYYPYAPSRRFAALLGCELKKMLCVSFY